MFLCLLAFVATFLTTRTITRMIRAGRGPFRNNVSESGIHVHHAVPGVVILIAGAFIAVGSGRADGWAEIAGILVGVGTSLVLDEFALILRLDDVYWSEEGRLSIQMVSLAVAVLGLTVLGLNPFQLSEENGADLAALAGTFVVLALHIALVLILVAKGRYAVALVGAFVPLVSIIVAPQIARPGSRWATRRYGADKMERATRRARRFDRRYGRHTLSVVDFLGGTPDPTAERPQTLEPPPAGSSLDDVR